MKRNYKSDFDFRLHLMSGGKEIGFPPCDWTLVLYAFHKSAAFTVLHIGGACVNCYNDDGTPHIVCNGHGMGMGRLKAVFTAEYPDTRYPDGLRKSVTPATLQLELWDGPDDCSGTLDLYIDLPHDCGTEGGSTEPGACAPEATWPEVSGAIDSLFKAN